MLLGYKITIVNTRFLLLLIANSSYTGDVNYRLPDANIVLNVF